MSNNKTLLYIIIFYLLPALALSKFTSLGFFTSLGAVLIFWIVSGNIYDSILDYIRFRRL